MLTLCIVVVASTHFHLKGEKGGTEGTGEDSQTGYSCYAGTSDAVLLYYRHTEEAYTERRLVFWVGSYKKKPKGSAEFVSPRRRKDKERKVVL